MSQAGSNKTSILNPISLNASRDHFSDLFNNFKKINNSSATKPSDSNSKHSILSDASNNESIDLVNVVEVKQNKLVALYVGDLDSNVTEEVLYNHFKRYPTLSSVKICYAPQSKSSLGYGYVNFESEFDAKRATEDLNYTFLLGQEIRIMPSLQGKGRHSFGTNVFISNLNLTSGSSLRSFYEKFREFGEIVSCKLDKKKRQGFISFADKKTAERFVSVMNESNLDCSRIYCSIHIPKSLRDIKLFEKTEGARQGESHSQQLPPEISSSSTWDTIVHTKPSAKYQTSGATTTTTTSTTTLSTKSDQIDDHFKQIYVKGLAIDVSETEILKLFSTCGKIQDVYKQRVEKFKSSWALVTFESCSSAKLAISNFHKTLHNGKRLTCVKALRKEDRQLQLSSLSSPSTPASTSSPDPDQSNESKHRIAFEPASKPKTHKVYIENLPNGMNENFFKLFLRNYTFKGKTLKYSINPLSEKHNNYIEFENEDDAKDVNAKINGVNVTGYNLQSALGEKPKPVTKSNVIDQVSRSSSLYREGSQLSFSTLGSPISTRSYPTQIKPSYQIPSLGFYPTSVNSSFVPLYRNKSGKVFQLIPLASEFQNQTGSNSAISRSPSFRKDAQEEVLPVSNESLMERLETAALQYIDFLKYPAATRSRNLTRILQYMVDTQWKNDLNRVSAVLSKLDTDLATQSRFKNDLLETLDLLGFARG